MDPSQLQDHTAFEETRVSSAFKDKIVLNETEVLSVGQVVASGTFEEMTDQKQIACHQGHSEAHGTRISTLAQILLSIYSRPTTRRFLSKHPWHSRFNPQ